MKIHYFQRYHAKENVATANTMLLLSRLYSYSSDKFFRFLKSEFFADSFEPEIVFNLQEKSVNSVPDATITQESFKIVVETKMNSSYKVKQLEDHLQSFGDQKFKVLLTLAPKKMKKETYEEFDAVLKQYNANQKHPVLHINTVFERVIEAIQETIDSHDYEMQEVLEDYTQYCYRDKLIDEGDAWKRMRVKLASSTFEFNMKENMYYDTIEHGFSPHEYLGLYKEKSVRAIGRIETIITATMKDGILNYEADKGDITEYHKAQIDKAIQDGRNYGFDFDATRYFFVNQFYETNFCKTTPRAPMGTRFFDLTKVLGVATLSDDLTIAKLLKEKTWE